MSGDLFINSQIYVHVFTKLLHIYCESHAFVFLTLCFYSLHTLFNFRISTLRHFLSFCSLKGIAVINIFDQLSNMYFDYLCFL